MRSQNIQTPNLNPRKVMQKCLKLSLINLFLQLIFSDEGAFATLPGWYCHGLSNGKSSGILKRKQLSGLSCQSPTPDAVYTQQNEKKNSSNQRRQ